MRLFRHPLLCNYYLTYRCNAKCSFCDIWEKPSPYVDEASFKANLRDLKRLGVKVIDFTGGEPLLHRQLPLFLRLAKQAGFITTVTTNCLLYPKHAQALHGLVDMLHFSIDAPDGAAHDASRGVKCFDHLLQSIQIAKQLGEKPDLLFTVMDNNYPDIGRIYHEIAQPNGLMLILNPLFSYNEVGGGLNEAALNAMEEWAWQPGLYVNEAFLTLRRDGGNHTSRPVCVAASTTLVISPENKLVMPCYHLGLEEIAIEGELYKLWHSSHVQELVKLEGRHPKCEGCVVNCYMQPSFTYQTNPYFYKALPSTFKYSLEKWVYA